MKEQISIEEIMPYVPHRIMCQYNGIINGKELSAQNKIYEKDGDPFDFLQPIYGLKIAPIKEIRIFKNYWKCYIGNYRIGLKSFVNGYDFKPLLIPLSEQNTVLKFDDGEYAMTHIQNEHTGVYSMKYPTFLLYVKNHFDVFNLLPRGLALNKLDVKL